MCEIFRVVKYWYGKPFQALSSLFLLKGRIWESLDNRALASVAFREALMTDVYCVEAFQALTQHNILSAAEEKELLKSMPLKVIFLPTTRRYTVESGYKVTGYKVNPDLR